MESDSANWTSKLYSMFIVTKKGVILKLTTLELQINAILFRVNIFRLNLQLSTLVETFNTTWYGLFWRIFYLLLTLPFLFFSWWRILPKWKTLGPFTKWWGTILNKSQKQLGCERYVHIQGSFYVNFAGLFCSYFAGTLFQEDFAWSWQSLALIQLHNYFCILYDLVG